MAKIVVPKEQLQGFKVIPAGVYELRLDGFKPKLTKDKPGKQQSVNLNPQLAVVNSADYNDQHLFENLNVGAWYLHDFVHAFGLDMEEHEAGRKIPGEFNGPDNDPTQWTYVGPLLGRVAKVRVVVKPNNKNQDTSYIDQWYCALPACQEKHSTRLQR